MVIIRSPDSATGQPGCQEYLTWERCSIRDTVAVNRFGCSCLPGGAADGGAADGGWADGADELAGGCGNSLGALPPQPALASASAAASTAGATAARILPTPQNLPATRPPGDGIAAHPVQPGETAVKPR